MSEETFKKPKCKLVGTDGNVFALLGTASKTLRRAGLGSKAKCSTRVHIAKRLESWVST